MEPLRAAVLVQHHRSEQLLQTVVAPDAIPINQLLVAAVAEQETTRTPLVQQRPEPLVASPCRITPQSRESRVMETSADRDFNKRARAPSIPLHGVVAVVVAQEVRAVTRQLPVQVVEAQEKFPQ